MRKGPSLSAVLGHCVRIATSGSVGPLELTSLLSRFPVRNVKNDEFKMTSVVLLDERKLHATSSLFDAISSLPKRSCRRFSASDVCSKWTLTNSFRVWTSRGIYFASQITLAPFQYLFESLVVFLEWTNRWKKILAFPRHGKVFVVRLDISCCFPPKKRPECVAAFH